MSRNKKATISAYDKRGKVEDRGLVRPINAHIDAPDPDRFAVYILSIDELPPIGAVRSGPIVAKTTESIIDGDGAIAPLLSRDDSSGSLEMELGSTLATRPGFGRFTERYIAKAGSLFSRFLLLPIGENKSDRRKIKNTQTPT